MINIVCDETPYLMVVSLRAVDTLNLTGAEKKDEAAKENLQKLILAVKSVEQEKFPFQARYSI